MIAEHELGHALGMGHANFKASLMSPTIGNDQPRDDIRVRNQRCIIGKRLETKIR